MIGNWTKRVKHGLPRYEKRTRSPMLKRTTKKPVWKMSRPRLINGDSTKKSILRKNSVDLTITSPPYNIGLDYEGGGAMTLFPMGNT